MPGRYRTTTGTKVSDGNYERNEEDPNVPRQKNLRILLRMLVGALYCCISVYKNICICLSVYGVSK